ncbi:MAG: hypothetical protein ABIB71_08670 [Candidatus Woesearchaeota archaeon]
MAKIACKQMRRKVRAKFSDKILFYPTEQKLHIREKLANTVMKEQAVAYSTGKICLSRDAVEGKGFIAGMDYARYKKLAWNLKLNTLKRLDNLSLNYSDYKGAFEFSKLQLMCPAPIGVNEDKKEGPLKVVWTPKFELDHLLDEIEEPDVDDSKEGYLEAFVAKGYAYHVFDSLFMGMIIHHVREATKKNLEIPSNLYRKLNGIREAFGCFVRDIYSGVRTLFKEDIKFYNTNVIDTSELQFYYEALYDELELRVKKSGKKLFDKSELIQGSWPEEKFNAVMSVPVIVETYAKEKKMREIQKEESCLESYCDMAENNRKERDMFQDPKENIDKELLNSEIELAKKISF